MGGATDQDKSAQNFRLLLLALMVLQNSSTVLVGRYTRSSVTTENAFVVNNFLVVTEFSKMMLSAMLEYHNTGGHLLASINEHIIEKPLDFLRITIPALLYLAQNTLLYVALSNLSAPLFQVTYQGKLLTTALVSVVLLNRRYNFRQWVCLASLGLGVAMVVLGESSSKKSNEVEELNTQDMGVGLVAVTIACLSSALAGVYFEKVLKNKSEPVPTNADGDNSPQQTPTQPPSLWMRNIQLAFFSVCTAGLRLAMERSRDESGEIVEKSFLHGFNSWVWLLVVLQAGGGLLVAAVMKYADNVLKGMATGVAVCFTSVCSLVLFGTPLQMSFAVGASIILTSVYFFANDLPCGKSKTLIVQTNDDREMKAMLPK